MIAALRTEAARRHPWLRAAYFHADIVRRTLEDAGVARGECAALDRPDALIDGRLGIDVVPDTPASRTAHRARGYITADEQLLTYPPPAPELLEEVFRDPRR
ncbi:MULTISPECIES: hypothetical protein [Actinomadura]|uniref:Uncharacterized protein n=1 Tax=Actinomadura yumaensis TaxID=111807 RepID=A0ABW2CII6_9ACTN|nr:hypothetical protein [Actinomadura sp. J1-007]MWK34956.1 hypothetical protein [Actinomadura sp. J1-007]